MSQADVDVVRRALSDAIHGDPRLDATWQAAAGVLHEEFEYHEDPRWPGAASYRGLAGFRGAVENYSEGFTEMRVDAEEYVDLGDRVLVFYRWSARSASGHDLELRQAGIFTVRDGLLASWQVFLDRERAARAAGLTS